MGKKVIIISIAILILLTGAVIIRIYTLKPDYSGEIRLKGIKNNSEVYFDHYGIPHIYAKSEEDAYFSLGYVVASERLFQMEMFRRLASGRLSETFGRKTFKSDYLFRTLNLNQHSEWSASEFLKTAPPTIIKAANAYLEGINSFIQNGPTPLEFTLSDMEKSSFSLKDVFLISGYLAFGFAEGFRTDPMVESLFQTVGSDFMKELEFGVPYNYSPALTSSALDESVMFSKEVKQILDDFPVSPWIGSNGWVLAPKKTKSGKTMLCNDTHTGYMQPAVWYEAHLEYPGFRHYGNYLPGFPFALTGHSDFSAHGITMLENDDTDFYIENIKDNQVQFRGEWINLKNRTETISIKDSSQAKINILETPHGPVINKVIHLPQTTQIISVWWNYLRFPSRAMETIYGLNHARSMGEARDAVSKLHAPGITVLYGDRDSNIARWTGAKLVKRREGLYARRFLEGHSGKDEPLGYYEFSENPHAENPESGFLCAANESPDSTNSPNRHQGYYLPNHRAVRITKKLSNHSGWTIDEMKKLITDDTNTVYSKFAKELRAILGDIKQDAIRSEAANRLSRWEGEHKRQTSGAVIYYKWIYNILKLMMIDELGQVNFDLFVNSHYMKNNYEQHIRLISSIWWDNKGTRLKEDRKEIIMDAWNLTMDELIAQLGKDLSKWTWDRLHKLELKHPLGEKFPLSYFFNIGPYFVPGGNEVINNTGFEINSRGDYQVIYGPSMRRIIDYSDFERSLSILPSGQSGYFLSPHYSDQTEKFLNNGFRYQHMNKQEILRESNSPLVIKPLK